MNPNKKGKHVRFQSTLDDEELNQIYLVIEIYVDIEDNKIRCIVKAINSGMTFPQTTTVKISELKICDN